MSKENEWPQTVARLEEALSTFPAGRSFLTRWTAVENAAAAYRLALQDMVNQWGGDETCISANEDAVEVLESHDAGKGLIDQLTHVSECVDREFKRRRTAEEKLEAAEAVIDAYRAFETASNIIDAMGALDLAGEALAAYDTKKREGR